MTNMGIKTTVVKVGRSEFNAKKIVISKKTGCWCDGLVILTEQETANVIEELRKTLAGTAELVAA